MRTKSVILIVVLAFGLVAFTGVGSAEIKITMPDGTDLGNNVTYTSNATDVYSLNPDVATVNNNTNKIYTESLGVSTIRFTKGNEYEDRLFNVTESEITNLTVDIEKGVLGSGEKLYEGDRSNISVYIEYSTGIQREVTSDANITILPPNGLTYNKFEQQLIGQDAGGYSVIAEYTSNAIRKDVGVRNITDVGSNGYTRNITLNYSLFDTSLTFTGVNETRNYTNTTDKNIGPINNSSKAVTLNKSGYLQLGGGNGSLVENYNFGQYHYLDYNKDGIVDSDDTQWLANNTNNVSRLWLYDLTNDGNIDILDVQKHDTILSNNNTNQYAHLPHLPTNISTPQNASVVRNLSKVNPVLEKDKSIDSSYFTIDFADNYTYAYIYFDANNITAYHDKAGGNNVPKISGQLLDISTGDKLNVSLPANDSWINSLEIEYYDYNPVVNRNVTIQFNLTNTSDYYRKFSYDVLKEHNNVNFSYSLTDNQFSYDEFNINSTIDVLSGQPDTHNTLYIRHTFNQSDSFMFNETQLTYTATNETATEDPTLVITNDTFTRSIGVTGTFQEGQNITQPAFNLTKGNYTFELITRNNSKVHYNYSGTQISHTRSILYLVTVMQDSVNYITSRVSDSMYKNETQGFDLIAVWDSGKETTVSRSNISRVYSNDTTIITADTNRIYSHSTLGNATVTFDVARNGTLYSNNTTISVIEPDKGNTTGWLMLVLDMNVLIVIFAAITGVVMAAIAGTGVISHAIGWITAILIVLLGVIFGDVNLFIPVILILVGMVHIAIELDNLQVMGDRYDY